MNGFPWKGKKMDFMGRLGPMGMQIWGSVGGGGRYRIEGEDAGSDSTNWGAFERWYGNLAQWKVPKICEGNPTADSWKSPNNPGCCKTKGWSLCTDCRAPLQRITPTHWPWRSWAAACKEPSPLFSSVLGVERCSADSRKRNRGTQPASKLLTYNMFCLQDILGQWWHRTRGGNQPMSDLTSGPHHETEPILGDLEPETD